MDLGIKNLLSRLQEFRRGGVYLINTPDMHSGLLMALNTLYQARDEGNLKYLTLQGPKASDIVNASFDTDFISKVKAHVYESIRKEKFLGDLTASLHGLKATDIGALQVVLFEDSQIKAGSDDFKNTITDLFNYAYYYSQIVVLISYGPSSQKVFTSVLKQTYSFSGLGAYIKTPHQLALDVAYWKASDGTFSQGRYDLNVRADGLYLAENSKEEFTSTDSGTCYICDESFTPDSNIFSVVKRFSDEQALYKEAIEQASSATVFLPIDRRDGIDDIARIIYDLRVKRGNALKIIVIEKIPGVRANSEHFLLACGANFIFESESKSSYINTMLPTLRAITYSKNIIASFETMLDNYQVLDREGNGFLMPEAFFDKVIYLLSKKVDEASVDGTLVTLRAKAGLDPRMCLTQFKPKRAGDYCTLIGPNIIVYLPSCRNGEIAVSLEHTFNTDPVTLFRECDAVYSSADIIQRVEELKSSPVLSYSDSRVMQSIIENSKQRQAREKKARALFDLAVDKTIAAVPYDLKLLNKDKEHAV